MNWNEVVQKVSPYVVKIETPDGHGTGFVCFRNDSGTFVGIATANHVVAHADAWQQPIRIQHYPSGTTAFLPEADRVVLNDADTDSAVILVQATKLQLPEVPIPLLPLATRLPIGTEVGWLGFPGVERDTLCFFAGNISAWNARRKSYLIDGVSIHGISGGPVLYLSATEGTQIIGAISAYIANRATGEALPGLAIAQDVSHFHNTITAMRSLDEARRKEAEQKAAAGEKADAPASGPKI